MRKHGLSLILGLLLLTVLPILVVQSQQLKTVRDILNDVWDRANHQLMGQPWPGGLASGQSMQTEQTIFNDVWDAPNHMLRVSATGGGGSGGPFNLITTGTNTGQTLTVGNTSILAPSGTGQIKSSAWNTVPSSCGTDRFSTAQDANGNMICAQVPFAGLTGTASDAQIPDLNTLSTSLTPSRCVETDSTGKLVSAAATCGTGGGGGGAGDVSSNTAVSTDSQVALFSGTTGKLIKRATDNGIPKLTGGVLSIAIPGTDYITPGGAGDVSSNTATSVDSELALFSATTGKLIKRAAGSGIPKLASGVLGFATPGTDYVLPGGNTATATNVNFSGLTSGTNTTAAMHVGAGAVLDSTGGVIDATALSGLAGSAYAKLAGGGTQILTGTQVDNRAVAQSIVTNAFTPNLDTTNIAVVPPLTAAVTVNAPSPATGGNPKDYHELTIVFQPTAVPWGITWNAIYSNQMGLALPTSTTGNGSTWDMLKFFYIPTVSKYVLAASTVGLEPGITTLGSSGTYTCPHATSRSCEMANTGSGGITIAIPSGGAPANGKQLVMKIKCNTLQNITLDTGAGGFIASPNVPITGLTCPAAGPSWTAIAAEYSTVLTRWQVYATN